MGTRALHQDERLPVRLNDFEQVGNEKERKVLESLADPAWDFRTIDGISKSTGLSKTEIENILDKHSNRVRKSPLPDRKGRYLFSLKTKPVGSREALSWVQSFVTKTLP